MSGRLIILPKKSYTPWNPQNIERVIKDEQIEREKNEREDEASLGKNRLSRIDLMKRNINSSKGTRNNSLQIPAWH